MIDKHLVAIIELSETFLRFKLIKRRVYVAEAGDCWMRLRDKGYLNGKN